MQYDAFVKKNSAVVLSDLVQYVISFFFHILFHLPVSGCALCTVALPFWFYATVSGYCTAAGVLFFPSLISRGIYSLGSCTVRCIVFFRQIGILCLSE